MHIIYYVDTRYGNDASSGNSWGTAWRTTANLKLLHTEEEVYDIEVRFAKTPGYSATYTMAAKPYAIYTGGYDMTTSPGDTSKAVGMYAFRDLQLWQDGYDLYATMGYNGWVVTAAAQDIAHLSVINSLGFCTIQPSVLNYTKLAYMTLASPINLTGYAALEFWSALSYGGGYAGLELTLNLCSDTLGEVVLASYALTPEDTIFRIFPHRIAEGSLYQGAVSSISISVLNPIGIGIQFIIGPLTACVARGAAGYLGSHAVYVPSTPHSRPKRVRHIAPDGVVLWEGAEHSLGAKTYTMYPSFEDRYVDALLDASVLKVGRVGAPFMLIGGYDTTTGLVDGTTCLDASQIYLLHRQVTNATLEVRNLIVNCPGRSGTSYVTRSVVNGADNNGNYYTGGSMGGGQYTVLEACIAENVVIPGATCEDNTLSSGRSQNSMSGLCAANYIKSVSNLNCITVGPAPFAGVVYSPDSTATTVGGALWDRAGPWSADSLPRESNTYTGTTFYFTNRQSTNYHPGAGANNISPNATFTDCFFYHTAAILFTAPYTTEHPLCPATYSAVFLRCAFDGAGAAPSGTDLLFDDCVFHLPDGNTEIGMFYRPLASTWSLVLHAVLIQNCRLQTTPYTGGKGVLFSYPSGSVRILNSELRLNTRTLVAAEYMFSFILNNVRIDGVGQAGGVAIDAKNTYSPISSTGALGILKDVVIDGAFTYGCKAPAVSLLVDNLRTTGATTTPVDATLQKGIPIFQTNSSTVLRNIQSANSTKVLLPGVGTNSSSVTVLDNTTAEIHHPRYSLVSSVDGPSFRPSLLLTLRARTASPELASLLVASVPVTTGVPISVSAHVNRHSLTTRVWLILRPLFTTDTHTDIRLYSVASVDTWVPLSAGYTPQYSGAAEVHIAVTGMLGDAASFDNITVN